MPKSKPHRKIAIFSRYSLADQYDLAAEFEGMLHELAHDFDVMHLSFRSAKLIEAVPDGVFVAELPFSIDRGSQTDILVKSLMMYMLLPMVAWKLHRFKPEAVFITERLPMYGIILKLISGLRVAIPFGDRHLHNRVGDKWWSKPLLRLMEFLERFEVSHVDGMFSRTEASRRRIHSYGVPHDHIQIVYDVAQADDYYPRDMSELRHKLGFSDEDIVLLYHGIMHCGKGLDMLIDWIADLHAEDARIKLIMVGSGPELEALKQQADRRGMGKDAYFTGWLPTVFEVGDYCNAADICIAMRRGDYSNDVVVPGALIRSMACRKVVLGPRLSAISEIIRHGENGYMFTPDNGEDFKRLIRELAQSRADWERVGDAAYHDTQKRFSVKAAEKAYAQAIASYANKPPPPN